MEEVRLYVDDYEEELLYSSSETICCRICHEAEFESCKTLESPCSCSGTVKFAHRDCIQRWCDEKGNTICEICLQKFEPGYSVPAPKKPSQLIHDTGVTIRRSLEVPRREENLEMAEEDEEERLLEPEYADCTAAADTSVSLCRTLALVFTILLLVRHSFELLIAGSGDYPFTLLTLLVIRASGILLPMYMILKLIDVVHNSITYQNQDSDSGMLSSVGEHEIRQHRVDID